MVSAWRYRAVLAEQGGPISRISKSTVSPTGITQFQALAYLRDDLKSRSSNSNSIYGTADGTGTDTYEYLACDKAVSEALERWAFRSLWDQPDAYKFGFDIEPTSTGMAAFPGLFSGQARRRAYFEAIERWSLSNWWQQGTPARSLSLPGNLFGVELATPWSAFSSTVIVWKKHFDFYSYGFAAARTLSAGIARAEVERGRNEFVLTSWRNSSVAVKSCRSERRLTFFSCDEGYKRFVSNLSQRTASSAISKQPRLILDQEVKGPWSRYATVWRCLFEPLNDKHLQDTEDFFYF